MNTYKEIVYYILDLVKLLSDDAYYNEDHVMFLLNKYRAMLLKKEYKDNEDEISPSNILTLKLNLEKSKDLVGLRLSGNYLVSDTKIPDTLLGTPIISIGDDFDYHLSFISAERLKYVGYNKFLPDIIYAAIGPDKRLYLKSENPQFKYLHEASISGVFENPLEIDELNSDSEIDPLDCEYPLEESLLPLVIDACIKNLIGAAYRPEDTVNDANDTLNDLARFIRANMKSNFAKQMDDD